MTEIEFYAIVFQWSAAFWLIAIPVLILGAILVATIIGAAFAAFKTFLSGGPVG